MIHTKDHKTLNIFGPFPFLGPKRMKLIETSWAKLFRDHVLLELPVNKIFRNYHWLKGRPTKELYAMLGLMILQQMHDLTDEEAIHQFAFNLEWHYALDITSESDAESYLCPKTLWTMRRVLTEQNLYGVLFESVTDKLAKVFSVDTSRQRYDSIHIFSNMRHLGRIGLFANTIRKFLVNLKRHERALFDVLDQELVDRYLAKQSQALFSMVKPSESIRTLESLGKDLFFLTEHFKDHPQVTGMNSYQLLIRLFKEQCRLERDEATQQPNVSIKSNREVPSDSLQNPSDPDAGYDGHKGKGYQMQVAETYCPEEKKKTLSLITEVQVESADKSDAHALIPLIEAAQQRGLGPQEVLADSLYGGDDNCEKASELGVQIISPVIGRPQETALSLANFTLTREATVMACPQGQIPVKTQHKKGKYTAVFALQTCVNCSRFNECPVKPGKKGYSLRYNDKAVRLAERRAHEKTPAFRELYRFRAGIEGTMSDLDRKTGVKRLRVRGVNAVSFCAILKAAGLNLFRAAAFKNREDREKRAVEKRNLGLFDLIYVFKERFSALYADLKNLGFYFNTNNLLCVKAFAQLFTNPSILMVS
jgi:hypothetical protein